MDDNDVPTPKLSPPLQNTSAPRDGEPEDVKKLISWQQKRMQRKLRGQQESLAVHLSHLVNETLDSPIRLSAVRVNGTPNTRQSFLDFLIHPLLPPPDQPPSFESVLHSARHISHRLNQTDLYKNVDVQVQRAKDVLANAGDVDILVNVREKSRWFTKFAVEAGNHDGSFSSAVRIRNLFGGAEYLEASVSRATGGQTFQGTFAAPVLTPDLLTNAELSAFGLQRNHSSFASCSEGLLGVRALIRRGVPSSGVHEVGVESLRRNIGNLLPTASMSIREAAGLSQKFGLFHSYTLDSRDDPLFTTRGVFLKLSHELASTSASPQPYYKTQAETKLSRQVTSNVALSLGLRAGAIWGQPGFSDRLFLGGPSDVRMLRFNGLGPKDGNDSLGGTLYYAAGLSVVTNVPRLPNLPIKPHFWVNAGQLDNVDSSRASFNSLSRPTVTAGVGLVFRIFDPVRVELNVGVPLAARQSDATRKGVQFGVGVEFL